MDSRWVANTVIEHICEIFRVEIQITYFVQLLNWHNNKIVYCNRTAKYVVVPTQ